MMIELSTVKLVACGFTMTIALQKWTHGHADIVATLDYEPLEYESLLERGRPPKVSSVRSVPFSISRDDIERLAEFVMGRCKDDDSYKYVFTVYGIGFHLWISEADDMEAHIEISLCVGMHQGYRVLSGAQGQVEIAELRRFADALINEVLPSSSA